MCRSRSQHSLRARTTHLERCPRVVRHAVNSLIEKDSFVRINYESASPVFVFTAQPIFLSLGCRCLTDDRIPDRFQSSSHVRKAFSKPEIRNDVLPIRNAFGRPQLRQHAGASCTSNPNEYPEHYANTFGQLIGVHQWVFACPVRPSRLRTVKPSWCVAISPLNQMIARALSSTRRHSCSIVFPGDCRSRHRRSRSNVKVFFTNRASSRSFLALYLAALKLSATILRLTPPVAKTPSQSSMSWSSFLCLIT